MTEKAITRREFLATGAAVAAATAATVTATHSTDAEAQSKPKSRLTTHVLDTYAGQPGAGMQVDFLRQDKGAYVLQKSLKTNSDGRLDEPLLPVEGAAAIGRYQLVFHVAEYYQRAGLKLPNPAFLDQVAVSFAIYEDKEHYHVPLLCSPWSYTTYRGS